MNYQYKKTEESIDEALWEIVKVLERIAVKLEGDSKT